MAALGTDSCLFVGDSEVDRHTATAACRPFALFTKGYRNRQEQNAGAGTFEIIGGSKRLSSFIGKKCNYAVKFYKDYVYLLSKCNISEKQKKILEEINN